MAIQTPGASQPTPSPSPTPGPTPTPTPTPAPTPLPNVYLTLLKVSQFGQGTIVDTGGATFCDEPNCQREVTAGQVITLTAKPAAGWALHHWVGCDSTTGDRCSVTVSATRTVFPYFARTTPIRLKSDVVVLDGYNMRWFVRREGSLFIFGENASRVAALRPGDVMVSSQGEGFARRVTSITALPGAFTYVDTRDASVEDVIAEGTLIASANDFRLALGAANDRKRAQASTTISYSLVNGSDDGVSGTIELALDPDAALDFDLQGLNEFKFIVGARIKPTIELKGSATLFEAKKQLHQRLFAPVAVGPVVFLPSVSLIGSVASQFTVAAKLGGNYEGRGTAGIHWKRGVGQQTVGDYDSTATLGVIGNLSDEATISASLGLELKGILRLYGLPAGPYVNATGTVEGKLIDKVSVDGSCPFRFSTRWDGGLNIGGEIDALTWKFDTRASLYSRGGNIFEDITPEACGDTQPPTKPGNVTARAVSPTEIALSWTASTDNSKSVRYQIRRAEAIIAQTAETTYGDLGLARDTVYCYVVVAVDKKGNQSEPSSLACARTPKSTEPSSSVPSNVQATPLSASAIRLTWTGSAPVYVILLDGIEVGRTSGNSFDVLKLARSTQYCFTVVAVNDGGASAQSTPACTRTKDAGALQMQIKCVDQPEYVVSNDLDLDTQSTSTVSVSGSGLDYNGGPLAYYLSGNYAPSEQSLVGRILWSFSLSPDIREDEYTVNLGSADTGDVPMNQVRVTGCTTQIRFRRR